uniref:Uncharacterized protein n=1 Tax=Anguilla anguilla TaxID=7936 RepID=A0A0E9P6L4_ANGAN
MEVFIFNRLQSRACASPLKYVQPQIG